MSAVHQFPPRGHRVSKVIKLDRAEGPVEVYLEGFYVPGYPGTREEPGEYPDVEDLRAVRWTGANYEEVALSDEDVELARRELLEIERW